LPKYQRKGIGTKLINHTIKLAVKRKIKAIVIFGDPHNYCKHGFKNAKDLNICNRDGKYPYGMLALELKKGALKKHKWKYRYSDVYAIDEKEVEKYDKRFKDKAKKYHYSQEIFSISIRSYLENKKAV
jgi:hypothetical protein